MEAMKPERLISAVPTPFDADGEIDRTALTDLLVELEPEVDAVLMAGTTAQFPALEDTERLELFELALGVFGPDRVIAHLGCPSLHQVHRLLGSAADLGVRRHALLTPYYLPVDTPAVRDWYTNTSARLDGAVLYPYLFPDRTGVAVDADLMRDILRLPGISGLKVSGSASRSLTLWTEILQPGQQLWSGNDGDLPGVLHAGGDGIISGVSAAFPRLFGSLRQSARLGQPLIDQAEVQRAVAAAGSSIPALHAALFLRTGHPWATRMPGPLVTEQQHGDLKDLIRHSG